MAVDAGDHCRKCDHSLAFHTEQGCEHPAGCLCKETRTSIRTLQDEAAKKRANESRSK
jgi:hypothetical protein